MVSFPLTNTTSLCQVGFPHKIQADQRLNLNIAGLFPFISQESGFTSLSGVTCLCGDWGKVGWRCLPYAISLLIFYSSLQGDASVISL